MMIFLGIERGIILGCFVLFVIVLAAYLRRNT